MGRKNNKVRQLDALGLDFDDMFGVESSAPKVKPSKPKESLKKSNVPPPKQKEPEVQPEPAPPVALTEAELKHARRANVV